MQPVDRTAGLRLRALWKVIGPFERLVGAEAIAAAGGDDGPARLPRDLGVRDGDAEALLGVREALVLAVVLLARVAEDHDPVGRERGQRVLDRQRRLALAGVAGGVDAVLLEPLDGLLLGDLGLVDRLVGVRDPERELRLVVAGETTSTSAPSTSSPRVARSRFASTGSGVTTSSFTTVPLPAKRGSEVVRRERAGHGAARVAGAEAGHQLDPRGRRRQRGRADQRT